MSELGGQRAASGGREQVVMFAPLPPARTGVAHYVSMLLPALREHLDIEVLSTPLPAARRPPPAAIYQLGNNPHHEFAYRAAMEHPGVVVLHDIVLHHLIVEMTLARGDVDGYIAALRANHGEAGAAWGRGRAAGLHSEMGNFLLPASIELSNRSRAVIVHNHYAADRLRSFGVRSPIHVVPHPFEPQKLPQRSSRGVIGFFGFLTSAKRADIVLAAFRKARQANPQLKLLVVGEPAPNIDTRAFSDDGITFTGYVTDEKFSNYFAEVDRLVNLRYPSAGETSGTLIRAFDAGKPVAVSDYAQFAELPDDCAVKIPLGDGEIDSLVDFFLRELPDPSVAQRRWLDQNARMELTVQGYLEALRAVVTSSLSLRVGVTNAIPLFPKLEIVTITDRTLTIRNAGDTTLRARVYGEPGYRLIADGRWIDLPRDLEPGRTAEISLPAGSGKVELRHGLQGIPMLEAEAWGRAAIR